MSVTRMVQSPTCGVPSHISLQGVHTHLLKDISVDIPLGQITAITGPSGSGKTSLAFDTLYAEAQSRFTESMSAYQRSLLRQSRTAKLDAAPGLGPAIAIGRKYLGHTPRSTVGTLTGLLETLRLVYSRIAQVQGSDLSASHFSFNHQLGACPACDGLGTQLVADLRQVLPHPELPLLQGALSSAKTVQNYADPHGKFVAILRAVAEAESINLELPFEQQTGQHQHILLHGTGDRTWNTTWHFRNKTRSGSQEMQATWLGICGHVEEEYARKLHNKQTDALRALLHAVPCATCQGKRLRPAALEVTLGGLDLYALGELELTQVPDWLRTEHGAPAQVQAVLAAALPGLQERLESLLALGLGHLSLNRTAASLSGGEGQRLRLAAALSAQLYGVTYVLDEPSLGLHRKDLPPLQRMLRQLIAQGNTVVMVEHDAEMIRSADFIVDMGPGAGTQGGEIVAAGSLDEIMAAPESPTGRYFAAPLEQGPRYFPALQETAWGVRGARLHHIQDLDLELIAGGLIALAGMSGSGKSTLMHGILAEAARGRKAPCRESWGMDRFQRVAVLRQEAPTGSAQSTVGTATGVMDGIQGLFAAQPAAKAAGLKKAAFSHGSKQGMCPDCKGQGVQTTALDFLGDVRLECESCGGTRYAAPILEVEFKARHIGRWLQEPVSELLAAMDDQPELKADLALMEEMGLGHLRLGQSTSSLSGGEMQRLRLFQELKAPAGGACLYLFDEPSSGLHFGDVERLLLTFQRLVRQGHTVMYIEHQPMMLQAANQLVELGPGAGHAGGKVISNEIRNYAQ